jgi:hypothetical protein
VQNEPNVRTSFKFEVSSVKSERVHAKRSDFKLHTLVRAKRTQFPAGRGDEAIGAGDAGQMRKTNPTWPAGPGGPPSPLDPPASGPRQGGCAKRTQFAGGRGEGQVLSGKRVMTNSTCKRRRKNKANLRGPGRRSGFHIPPPCARPQAALGFGGILIALRGPRADNPAGADASEIAGSEHCGSEYRLQAEGRVTAGLQTDKASDAGIMM